ncbi:MAG TPA: hypothetical protein VND66_06290 [Acidobacteriaceae bacterium]|nr:hypothetical protein [Acidobacteriaceae bacterium]
MIPDLHEFLARAKSLFRKRRMDREMADELEFHQALLRERLERQGAIRAERMMVLLSVFFAGARC